MKQIIYRSQPFGFDRAILASILVNARRNNGRDDITGALICRNDLYLQLLEGPEPAIDAAYARIVGDDRHCDVRLMLARMVDDRMFPEWEMLDDEMPSATWSPAQIADGAFDTVTSEALVDVFARIAAGARARLATS